MSTKSQRWHIGDYELSPQELADIVWLAAFMDEPALKPIDSGRSQDVPEMPPSITADPAIVPPKPSQVVRTEQESSREQPHAQANIYTSAASGSMGSSSSLSGTGFPVGRPQGLLGKTALMRSLRPLLQRVPSRSLLEIDEEETAERIANAFGYGWEPALRPAAERVFDLLLLVEESPSMGVWHGNVRELRQLLIQTGIFRNVHSWALTLEETADDGLNGATQMSLRTTYAVPGMSRRTYEATELIDPQQRRLILVVSDCISAAWDNGAVLRILQPLAAVNIVSILQLLPKGLWDMSALSNAVPVSLAARQLVTSNTQIEVQSTRKGYEQSQFDKTACFPVIALNPSGIKQWAHFIVGRQQHTTGYYFRAELQTENTGADFDLDAELRALGIEPDVTEASPASREHMSSVDLIFRDFLGTVPPSARRLAAYFAAAPLTLPIMRIVHQAMFGLAANHADFVWVYYSKLIQRITPFNAQIDPDQVIYDFVGGEATRRRLLDTLPRQRIEQVYDVITEYVAENVDQLDTFLTTLYVSGMRGTLPLDGLSRRVAEVSVSVLRYLGGIYSEMATRIEHQLDPASSPVTHPNGVKLWVGHRLMPRVVVGARAPLIVQVTSTEPVEVGAADGLAHMLGELSPGTEVRFRVEALDGSFVVRSYNASFVVADHEQQHTWSFDLQANALGEAELLVTALTSSETLVQVDVSGMVMPEQENAQTSMSLRLEADPLYHAGKFTEAEQKYTSAIALGANAKEVYRYRAEAREALYKYGEAEADFSAAIARGADDSQIFGRRGKVRSRLGNFDGAISDLDHAIKITPNLATLYHDRGFIYGDIGRFELAEQDFGTAIQLAPTATLYRNRGLAHKLQGNFVEALVDYTKSIELDPHYARAYRSRGDLYREMDQIDEALADYTSSISLDPTAASYNNRGLANREQGTLDAALADFAHALQLDPGYKLAYDNQGDVYYDLGEYQKAIAAYTQVISLDPTYIRAYNGRGLCYKMLGDTDAALADFAQTLQLDPGYKLAYDNQGDVYFDLGEYQKAIAAYNEAISLDPTYIRAYNGRGLCYKMLGDTDAALADFAQAIQEDDSWKWGHYNRGEVYRERAEYLTAIAAYSQAITIDPAYGSAYVGRALAYGGLKDRTAALADFDKAVALEPNDMWAQTRRIDAIDELIGASAAERELQRLRDSFPDNSQLIHHVGTVYGRHGNREAAQAAYLEAEQLYFQDLANKPTYENYLNRGLLNMALFRWAHAIRDFTDAIALRSHSAEAYSERGSSYDEVEDYDNAIADYKRAILLNKGDAYPYYNLATVLAEQHDFSRALIECQKGIDMWPENAHGYMVRASIYARRRDTDRATQDAQRALELAPDDVQVQRFNCTTYCRIGSYTTAIEHGRRAIAGEPGDPSGHVWLGHSLLLAGNTAEAHAHYEQSITLRRDTYFYRGTIRKLVEVSTGRAIDQYALRSSIALFENAIAALARQAG